MNIEKVMCDYCKKESADPLHEKPKRWISISPVLGERLVITRPTVYGYENTLHFCTTDCLVAWINDEPKPE